MAAPPGIPSGGCAAAPLFSGRSAFAPLPRRSRSARAARPIYQADACICAEDVLSLAPY